MDGALSFPLPSFLFLSFDVGRSMFNVRRSASLRSMFDVQRPFAHPPGALFVANAARRGRNRGCELRIPRGKPAFPPDGVATFPTTNRLFWRQSEPSWSRSGSFCILHFALCTLHFAFRPLESARRQPICANRSAPSNPPEQSRPTEPPIAPLIGHLGPKKTTDLRRAESGAVSPSTGLPKNTNNISTIS